jgi:signal transduction histidine kinase
MKDISDEKRRRNLERIFFHDVMNIVGMIYNTAEFYMENGHQDAAELDPILYHQTVRLVDEIKAQRDLLAAENGELQVHLVPINSLQVLNQVCEAYRMYHIAHERHLVVAEDSSEVVFNSDQTLLMRVLGNMVKNALESSAKDETVTVRSQHKGEYVVFEVHNPTVMPHAVQLQMFQRSFSTKGQERGLGTYSMKLLTERYLGGQVGFSSTRERGTVFWACYPL